MDRDDPPIEFSVVLPRDDLIIFDAWCEVQGYSRSEGVRLAMQEAIRASLPSGNGEAD